MVKKSGMLKLTGYIKIFISFLIPFLLWSCKDDSSQPSDPSLEAGGVVNVTFSISCTDALSKFATSGSVTRAVDESMEGTMSNLYVVAVKVYDYEDESFVKREKEIDGVKTDNPAFFVTSLNPLGHEYIPGDTYKNKYTLELYPGKYRFYIFANFDLYLTRFGHINDFSTEQEIREITLNYKADTPLMPGHLPMTCLPENIKWRTEGSTEANSVSPDDDNLIEIKDSNKELLAEMIFQCAKVRYTILYNNTKGGCSEAFGNNSVRFNVDYNQFTVASNLNKTTYLLDHEWTLEEKDRAIMTTDDTYQAYPNGEATEFDQAYWSINLGRYQFKEKNGTRTFNENYPVKPTDDSIEPWTGTTSEWMASDQRVWQGVCYLPENNIEGIDHTILAFPYVYDKKVNGRVVAGEWDNSKFKLIWLFGNNTNEQHYPGLPDTNGSSGNYPDVSKDNNYSGNQETFSNQHGLTRGMMYDVVAKVVNPEDLEMDIQVYINVLAWTHHTSEANEW